MENENNIIEEKENNMDKSIYKLISENLNIIQIAKDLGLLTETQIKNKNYMVSCFNKRAHANGDKLKSAKIYEDSNQYHCFACAKHTDSIGLYSEYKRIPIEDAMKELCVLYNINIVNIEDIKDDRKEKKEKEIKKARGIFL